MHKVMVWFLFALLVVGGYFSFISLREKSDVNEKLLVKDSIEMDNRVIRYGVSLNNTSAVLLKEPGVSMFVPVTLKGRQKLILMESNVDDMVIESGMAKFNLDAVPPYGKKGIVMTAEVSLSLQPALLDESESSNLKNGDFLAYDSIEIKQLIQQLSKKQGEYPEIISQWALQNINYIDYIQEDRGALYALKTKQGDCTEYMYVLLSLLRGKGIEAKGMAGFYLGFRNQVMKAKDYHNWVEYKGKDGRWHILDPLNENINKGYGQYVVLREVSVDETMSKLTSQRFLSHDARLDISMY